MNKMTENEFLSASRLHLDKSIAQLDADIALRLDSMREQALDPSGKVAVALDELQDPRATDKRVQTIRTNLEHSASVPPEIEARLDDIRRRAIAQLELSREKSLHSPASGLLQQLGVLLDSFKMPMPARLVATACVMVTAVSLFFVASRPPGAFSFEEEISLIASADDIELYENLEFYLWLAETELPN